MNRPELALLVQVINRIGFLQSQLGVPLISDVESQLLQQAISRQEMLIAKLEEIEKARETAASPDASAESEVSK